MKPDASTPSEGRHDDDEDDVGERIEDEDQETEAVETKPKTKKWVGTVAPGSLVRLRTKLSS